MTNNKYFLAHGSHGTREAGMCSMEWVAYIAGEEHTDQPVCVSPVLRSFGISLNDRWNDEQRQKLRPYLARCIGTAGDGRDEERGWLATDWLIRTFTPRFLDLCPSLAGEAAKLRGVGEINSPAMLNEAMFLLNQARSASAAAGAAAWAAAWDAAWAATWAAASAAARAAAGAAASAAAWAATWAAASAAAGDAAWAAAGDALAPAVDELQKSALDLFDRMLPTEIVTLPVVEESEWRALCRVS